MLLFCCSFAGLYSEIVDRPRTHVQIQQRFLLGEKPPTYKQLKLYALDTPGQNRPDADSFASTSSQASGAGHAAQLKQHMATMAPVFDAFLSHMRKHTYMLWAKTYDLSWAFHVFKSMNDTGRPLTDIDKLKALVLNSWKHEQEGQITRAREWNDSIEQAGGEKPFKHVIIHMAVANGMDKRMSLLDYMVSRLFQAHWTFFRHMVLSVAWGFDWVTSVSF